MLGGNSLSQCMYGEKLKYVTVPLALLQAVSAVASIDNGGGGGGRGDIHTSCAALIISFEINCS